MAAMTETETEISEDEEIATTNPKRTRTARDELATTGPRKPDTPEGDMVSAAPRKKSTDEDEVGISAPRKSTTVGDVKTGSPANYRRAASTDDKVEDKSSEVFMKSINALLHKNNEAIRGKDTKHVQKRPKPPTPPPEPKPRRRCSKVLLCCLGTICCLLVVIAVVLTLVTGTSTACTADEEGICTKANATCSRRWFKPSCKCNVAEQLFDGGLCRYQCDHDPQTFCPDGVCYAGRCFQDVYSFVTSIYKEKCKEVATEALCTVTCTDILKYVCVAKTLSPVFCHNSNPMPLKDFSCQSGDTSDGFIGLTADEEQVCMKDQNCRRLMTLYPCLAGYVSKGRVFCSKGCVVPKDLQGTTVFYNGYCFLKKANCDGAMAKLVEILKGSDIGYPYTTRDFRKYSGWTTRNLRRIPNLPRLIYPLMLAYGVLGEEGKVDIQNDAPGSVSQFNETLENAKVQTLLKSLYASCTDIIEFLRTRIRQMADDYVYKDRYLRVAFLVSTSDCKTFNECPAINSSIGTIRLAMWAQRSGIYCSLSRALFSVKFTVDATWYESIARLQGWPQLSTKSVSFIYSPSFVSNLISQTSSVIGARRLDNDVFNRSRNLCDIDENVRTINRDYTIIPMALSDALGWVENEPTQPKRLSSFALILANAVSVKKAICNEEGSVPSIDCELRLFLAFRAFLPEPCKEEKDLIANGDKVSLYFTLRAAMRRQLSWGSKTTHSNNTNPAKISEAAKYFVSQCLERIPN